MSLHVPPIDDRWAKARRGAERWLATVLTHAGNAALLIILVLAANYLGPEDYGKFAFLLATSTIVGDLTVLGLPTYLQRDLARRGHEARGLLWNALRIQAVLGVAGVAAVMAIVVAFAPAPGLLLCGFLLAVASQLRFMKLCLRGALRGRSRFGVEAGIVWFERILLFGATFAVLMSGGNVLALAIAFFVVRALDAGVMLLVARRIFGAPPPAQADLHGRSLVARTLPLGLSNALWAFYLSIGVLMLGGLSTAEEVGHYHAMYRFVDIALEASSVLTFAFFPALSAYHVSSRGRFSTVLAHLVGVSWSLAALLCFAGPLVAPSLVAPIFGEEYAGSGGIAAMLAVVGGLALAGAPFRLALFAADRENWVILCFAGAAACNVVANALLIPRHGADGATEARLISEVVMAASYVACSLRAGMGIAWLRPGLYCAAFGAAAFVVSQEAPSVALVAWIGYAAAAAPLVVRNIRALLGALGE